MFSIRLHRLIWLVTGVGLAVAILVLFQAWRADAIGSEETTFVPVSPCRLMDLRAGSNVGPRSTPIEEEETYVLQITGSNGDCTIPGDAAGVAMNVTALNATASSFLQLWPADEARPTQSNLNYLPGQAPTPNKVDVKLSPTGAVGVFNRFGTVDVIADVVGYYTNSGLADLETRVAALETGVGGADLTALLARIDALEANDAAQDATIASLAADVATLQSDVDALQTDVGTLQTDVAALQTDVGTLQTDVGTLQTDVAALQTDVAALQTLTASMSLETVDGQPVVRFTRVNVQIVDGSGNTAGANSLGNLIIGYNARNRSNTGDDQEPLPPDERTRELWLDLRSGSHNLIVGDNHTYSSWGGFVAGANNRITGTSATVVAGTGNAATSHNSVTVGGFDNDANGNASVIVGGRGNESTGEHSAVLGGESNDASNVRSTVAGGFNNHAAGRWSAILGGINNTTGNRDNPDAVSGQDETIVGGDDQTCAFDDPQPQGQVVTCGEGIIRFYD
jgi:uncharacterized coiled-coil protein SlyX